MLAKTESVALVGTAGHLVQVEVYVKGGGLPTFRIVGLPAASVREADQRVKSAIESTGAPEHHWPSARIIANLAPGNLRKEGTHFDLALALGVLAGARKIPAERLEGWVIVGELALDGSVRPVRGVLAAAMACREAGRRGLICPTGNAHEAAIVDGIEVVPVDTLGRCMAFMEDRWTPAPVKPLDQPPRTYEDISEVRGHDEAKKAVEIAAAGGHHLLMIGPPGSGKSMIARRIPGILPPMSVDESLEVTAVFSVAGLLGVRAPLITARPFRSPHQGVSLAGLIGGGSGLPRPGEISLAHHGVLFLDEISLFRSDVLDSLRGPLEDGIVRIARSAGVVTYPCRFSLVAAMNPCPCGYSGDEVRECTCTPARYRAYSERLSGPLIDRFDIQAVMKRPSRVELMSPPAGETSEDIRARVHRAREIQEERYRSPMVTNASCSKAQLERTVTLTTAARSSLGEMIDLLDLTGRGVDRVKRLSRTIADLSGSEPVENDHVGLALNYRFLEAEAVAV